MEDSANAILNLDWPVTNNGDRLYWCGNNSGLFSVSNCYAINTSLSDLEQRIWKTLWKSKQHDRLKIFIWCALSNIFPTKEVLSRRVDIDDPYCVVCGEELEKLNHLFKDYSGFRALAFASSWGGKPNAWPMNDVMEILVACINPPMWMCCGVEDR